MKIERKLIKVRKKFLKVYKRLAGKIPASFCTQKKMSHGKKKTLLILGAIVMAFFLIIAVVFTVNIGLAMMMPIPDFSDLENVEVRDSTKIYDNTGIVMLYDVAQKVRQSEIKFESMSPYLGKAIIAIEDEDYYEHNGVRFSSMVRAIKKNISHASFVEGGSTITQQVVKNTLLNKDKSLIRKIKEIILARRIENIFTKEQILEKYLNEIPYGGTMYGVEEASMAFFGKNAKDVSLAEAAYLAALPRAPTYYSPWGDNVEALEMRKNMIMEKMLQIGLITEEEHLKATEENVEFSEKNYENIRAPHFVFYVLGELEKKFGAEEVYQGSLRVVTTLDLELQNSAEDIINKGALKNAKTFDAENAGLVAIVPETGHILAMVGSRGYFDENIDGKVNTTLSHRQPGSTFKPFVYATAFSKGYTPETILFDLKTQFSTACRPDDFSNKFPCYSPANYDDEYRGPVSLRSALAESINVPSVKTLYLAGINESLITAKKMGITTLEDASRYGLTLVLGGGEVTLLEMTSAYGVFANEGIRHEETPFLSVEDYNSKKILYEYKESEGERVLDKNIARTINSILSDNEARAPSFGLNSPLHFPGQSVAAKTGTTNDYRDMWVVGYTPMIAVGIWAGNNDNRPMEKKIASFIVAPIWNEFMNVAIKKYHTIDALKGPNSNVTLASTDSLHPLLKGEFDDEMISDFHEILYFLDKDYPLRGVLQNPPNDPQLALWDYPVAVWANQNTATSSYFAILSPQSGGTLGDGETITVQVMTNPQANIMNVAYYLNGQFSGLSINEPFNHSIDTNQNGPSVLRAVATSVSPNDGLLQYESSVSFTIEEELVPGQLTTKQTSI